MNKIDFKNADLKFALKNKNEIRKIIRKIFIDNDLELRSLSIIFGSDSYLLDLNTRFLNHNYYTDILTFDLSILPQQCIGEIYISIERTKENSMLYQVDWYNEISRVIIHGCLHLCGFRDKSAKEIKLMRKMENNYLGILNCST